jgi:hypothetical protein
MFDHPIPAAVGDIVERDGFIFADVYRRTEAVRSSPPP